MQANTLKYIGGALAVTVVAELIAPLSAAVIQNRCPGALEQICILEPHEPPVLPTTPLAEKPIAVSTAVSSVTPMISFGDTVAGS